MAISKKTIIGSSVLLSGETPQDIQFKAFLLSKLRSLHGDDRLFSMDELLVKASDFPHALPASRMEALIDQLPVLEKEGDRYRIKSEIDLAEWFRKKGAFLPKKANLTISWDEIGDVIGENQDQEIPWSVFQVRESIRRGLDWCLLGVRVSSHENSQGLPAFWDCTEAGLMPVGYQQAGTCNSDTLGALVGSLFGPVAMDLSAKPDNAKLLGHLLQYNLNCLVTPEQPDRYEGPTLAWNLGGFLPKEDQPGAEHPTVDATANYVISASVTYLFYDDFKVKGVPFPVDKQTLGESIVLSLGFQLRSELQEGAWGIYRYQDDIYPTAPNPFTTALTVISLGLVKMCGVLDDLSREELYGTINASLLRTLDFLMGRRTEYRGYTAWTMSFSDEKDRIPEAEIFGATLFCCKALFSMTRGMPQVRERVYPILRDFVRSMEANWNPQYNELYAYEFRVPLETELNGTFNAWEIRYDVRLSAFLLDLHNESGSTPELDITLSRKLWTNIEITIGHLLKEQHPELGHWIDPINKRPFAVSTLFALETLQAYLQAVKNMFAED